MSTIIGLVLGLLIGALVGGLAVVFLRRPDGVRKGRASDASLSDGDMPAEPTLTVAALQQSLFERTPIGLVALDSSDELVLVNRRARELGALRHRRVVEPLLEIARTARASGETLRDATLSTGGLPPRNVFVRVAAIPLPQRIMALVVEDITDARRVDEIRRDFVANVSHEIKTPVGALRLLADAALESLADVPDAHETRHFVERMAHESARLGRLVSELLDLSRLQGAERPAQPVPVRLDDVVAEAVDRAAAGAEAKEIDIVRGAPSDALVLGVETQLITAVANLLDNAVNYSPEGTRVAVAVKQAGNRWELTVSDQGVGIPDDDLDRIFERFYRVDPARSRATGGTGLGLAIVKHIVRNHGGDIRVWSSPTAGSTFTLCFPAAPEPEHGHAAGPGTSRSAGAAGEEPSVDTTSRPVVRTRGVR